MMSWKLFVLSLLLAFAQAAHADNGQQSERYEPAKTTIVLLPLVNKAAEYSANFREKTRAKAEKAISERFSSRGFQIADPVRVQKCLDEMKLDMNERENWREDKILAVGKRLEAQLVLLPVILDAHSKDNNNVLFAGSLFGGSKEGFASVRAYLVDTNTGVPLLKGDSKRGKTTSGIFSSFEKGMDRQTTAVVKGFDAALIDFLAQYPVEKSAKEP